MDIALISSTADPASVNIKERLILEFQFKETTESFQNNSVYHRTITNKNKSDKGIKIYTIADSLIHANNIDEQINADFFIFLSKHRAQEGRATLTVHPIGNFSTADFGGRDKKLCPCPSSLLKLIFIELSKAVENTNYEATLEATHHGPYLQKPVLFLELGSAESHWNDVLGGKLVARALMNALELELIDFESCIVLGGSHYGHVPNKKMLKSDHAVGHMCPKYHFINLDDEMLLSMVENTLPRPSFALLDWKGLGPDKQKIVEMLERNKISYKRSDQMLE